MLRRSPDETTGSGSGGPVPFPPTLWTIVLEAKSADPGRAQAALGELCVHYREAILRYFRLKCRHPQDAEDLAGSFIVHLLELKRLGSFDPKACPRFRAYLSVALKNFFLDWLERRSAEKRGLGRPDESIEQLIESGFESATEDPRLQRAVDLEFTRLTHQRVMAALGAKAPDPARFAILRDFMPCEHGPETYAQAARRLGVPIDTFRKAVFDLRKNYVKLFRATVSPTVGDDRKEFEDEVRFLVDLLLEAVVLDTNKPDH